mmetsp:Transcript_12190/g.27935  ORF Transcript_12190/g.27935 Transcript_12190/m.27935 type:complete len:219 (-) Transcript_12190:16-672(-)
MTADGRRMSASVMALTAADAAPGTAPPRAGPGCTGAAPLLGGSTWGWVMRETPPTDRAESGATPPRPGLSSHSRPKVSRDLLSSDSSSSSPLSCPSLTRVASATMSMFGGRLSAVYRGGGACRGGGPGPSAASAASSASGPGIRKAPGPASERLLRVARSTSAECSSSGLGVGVAPMVCGFPSCLYFWAVVGRRQSSRCAPLCSELCVRGPRWLQRED